MMKSNWLFLLAWRYLLCCNYGTNNFGGAAAAVDSNDSSTRTSRLVVPKYNSNKATKQQQPQPLRSTKKHSSTSSELVNVIANKKTKVQGVLTSKKQNRRRLQISNEVCENAIPFLSNTETIGSTVGAILRNATSLPPCLDDIEAPGVWYRLEITEDAIITADTCHPDTNYDTRISVFTGTCTDLVCVDGNDDASDWACDRKSSVTWTVRGGSEIFYILVHGYGTEVGDFTLRIGRAPLEAPANDFCQNSLPMLSNPITGTTDGATVDDGYENCGVDITAPSVWYRVPGTDETITAYTCASDILRTNFDTKISVYQGSSCATLVCVGGNDDSDIEDCQYQSLVSWVGSSKRMYYILVHGYGIEAGDFSLTLDRASAPAFNVSSAPSNDLCENAIAVFGIRSGTTEGATLDNVGTCGVNNTAPGVWYTISSGANENITASTCNSNANFDTKISVFRGGVNNLVCVDGNDDAFGGSTGCDTQSSVSWTATDPEIFYILVHGYGSAVGSFQLDINRIPLIQQTMAPTPVPTPVPVPNNDSCESATTITSSRTGTTQGATVDNIDNCGEADSTGSGVWYILSGSGSDITVDTCRSNSSSFDTQISVFRGSCSDLICVAGNDDAADGSCAALSSVTWTASDLEQYFILVHGYEDEVGDFVLTVDRDALATPSPSPPNNTTSLKTPTPVLDIATAAPTDPTTPVPRDPVSPTSLQKEDDGISLGIIVGVAVGGFAVVLVALAIGVCIGLRGCCERRRSDHKEGDPDVDPTDTETGRLDDNGDTRSSSYQTSDNARPYGAGPAREQDLPFESRQSRTRDSVNDPGVRFKDQMQTVIRAPETMPTIEGTPMPEDDVQTRGSNLTSNSDQSSGRRNRQSAEPEGHRVTSFIS